MNVIDEVLAALLASDSATVYIGTGMAHADRVILALQHDVNTVYDVARSAWACSFGVPEEVARGYAHESDVPIPAVSG